MSTSINTEDCILNAAVCSARTHTVVADQVCVCKPLFECFCAHLFGRVYAICIGSIVPSFASDAVCMRMRLSNSRRFALYGNTFRSRTTFVSGGAVHAFIETNT